MGQSTGFTAVYRKPVSFLDNIATYAINKHDMHVVINVHSLPGGVNGMAFGEAEWHFGWFNNQTALDYSLEVIDAVISYVQGSGYPELYTIAPINEPVDNQDLSFFGTPLALSGAGAARYFAGRGATSENIASYIRSDAEASPSDGGFPVFIGELSVQAEFDNTLASRERALNTGLYAFAAHTRGSAYWTAKFFGNNTVNGEGTQAN
ncbi:glycoside hydrolase superfamily [Aspergillus filifer]